MCRTQYIYIYYRRGDGRAVLRSSVREFLASEAMHHLGVHTTRALGLIVSEKETVMRSWYRPNVSSMSKHGGDVYQKEPCAMCTRVARTFVRVGTFELVGRRARRGEPLAMRDLEALTRYTLRRDFAELQAGDLPPGDAAMARSWLAIF